jgi:hypothetical protein
VDIEIIEYLEKIYLQNYSEIFTNNFSQFILKDETLLIDFLLKYYMKDSANLVLDKLDKELHKENIEKIELISNKSEKRRFGIIDQNFAFEFFDVLNGEGSEMVGYLANKNYRSNNGKDYVSLVKEEIRNFH